jgi:hypothetical protein
MTVLDRSFQQEHVRLTVFRMELRRMHVQATVFRKVLSRLAVQSVLGNLSALSQGLMSPMDGGSHLLIDYQKNAGRKNFWHPLVKISSRQYSAVICFLRELLLMILLPMKVVVLCSFCAPIQDRSSVALSQPRKLVKAW